MLETLAASLDLLLAPVNFLVLAIGLAIGIVMGAIPGMTTPMAVALALPFTFTLGPMAGVLLLLGVYKGGLYGGSISAILIRTPGTPAAACTVLDGHPLAARGEARKALEMALYASCVADFVSNLALIGFTGVLAAFALRFGPPEFFALILFSLTIIAGVAGESLLLGLLSACLGLVLATVGLDIIYGTGRFVFGSADLMAGLNFLPLLIGLFAIPEVIAFYVERSRSGSHASANVGPRLSLTEFRASLGTILRGSLIGVILGAIPGIGGAPAAFLSYNEARRTSARPQDFGKGEIRGVAAAEAGNNGVAGATMIPLLALGVPGDVTTAVILGAFMIHGLRPGPSMFAENEPMIYALFMGLIVSSLFMLVLGKAAIRVATGVTRVPARYLYPSILIFCVFGAYAVNNSVFDVFVMLIFGLLGYGFRTLALPTAPLLIAFILGPLLEDSFRQALRISGGSFAVFFQSTVSIVFWILAVLSLVLITRARRSNIQLSG
jgi:putative tricarboxylic transport membrane protein